MKKILMIGLITALCLSGCGSKPAESKTESVDISGRELFSITVGDETLDLTTCTIEQLFKLLQKAGIDTGVPEGTMEAYKEDIIKLDDDKILLEYYNPYNEERPWAQSRIYSLEIKFNDRKCEKISLVGGKVKIGEDSWNKYKTAFEEYGIAYNNHVATQVVNDFLQEGTMTIGGGEGGGNVSFRKIEIPQVME